MINNLCALFTQEAPEITKKLPVSMAEESESPIYLDFIRRLALKGLEILEFGDNPSKKETHTFSRQDCAVLLGSGANIKDLVNGDCTSANDSISKLPAALRNIHRFFANGIKEYDDEAKLLEGELADFQNVTKPTILEQGDKGYAILYGGLDETPPDHLQKSTVSLADLAVWKNEQEEVLGYYVGASTTNPAMLSAGGKTHKEEIIEGKISACEGFKERYKELAHDILALINKLNAIGLTVQASCDQEDSRLETSLEDFSPSAS